MKISFIQLLNIQTKAGLVASCLLFVCSVSLRGQSNNNYPVVRTSQNVSVNRSVPKNRLSNMEAIPVSFSSVPTDEEIFGVNFFEEPLVPSDNNPIDEENTDLVNALVAYSQRKNPDDFTMLKRFLKADTGLIVEIPITFFRILQ